MTILDKIVAHKRLEVAAMPHLPNVSMCRQDFSEVFNGHLTLIAEIKAASPSEGSIVQTFNPLAIAGSYVAGGASAISVLTDQKFFKGSFDILASVGRQTNLPLLCKDFIISEKQIRMARAHGADMCLLIVKILEDQQLAELKRQIENLGMIAVIEIQNPQELERALAVNPRIILINNRHLDHFTVDLSTSENLAEKIPSHIHVIAASGIKTPEDLNRFSSRINGFLIGTSLMQAEDKENYLRECRRVRLPAPRT